MELITPFLAVMCVVLVVLLWREAWAGHARVHCEHGYRQGRRNRFKPSLRAPRVVGQHQAWIVVDGW